MGCRQLSCGNRSSVYAYLAVYLPCGKETLKTRAKKLRENMETDLLKEPMQKLKEGKILNIHTSSLAFNTAFTFYTSIQCKRGFSLVLCCEFWYSILNKFFCGRWFIDLLNKKVN